MASAGTLVHEAGCAALERPDVRELVIVADPAEGAIRLYRRLGFDDDGAPDPAAARGAGLITRRP